MGIKPVGIAGGQEQLLCAVGVGKIAFGLDPLAVRSLAKGIPLTRAAGRNSRRLVAFQ
jgi:hypothetical protein